MTENTFIAPQIPSLLPARTQTLTRSPGSFFSSSMPLPAFKHAGSAGMGRLEKQLYDVL
jgi:hypothetical protein